MKATVFLYSNMDIWKFKQKPPFPIESGNINFIGDQSDQKLRGIYIENYKAFLRKILKDLNKWTDTMFMDQKTQCQLRYQFFPN